jgi:hypothetical protein
MDVKTARIRGLLNELADRPAPEEAPEAAPSAEAEKAAASPLLVARVGAPAGNAPLIAAAIAKAEDDDRPGQQRELALGASAGQTPGLRPVPEAARKPGRGKAGAKAAAQEQTHAQRNLKHFVVDDEGPLEDNLMPPPLPCTLRGISGIDDNGSTFLAEAQAILARRRTDPALRAAMDSGEDITDASEGAA